MARPADASIIFDTRLDPEGFENGINNIDDSFERMRNTLVDVASASSEAFSSKVQKNIETMTSRLARQLEQLDKARSSVEKLRNEYNKLVSGETTPKSIQKMEEELAKVNAEMQKELANNERILQSYVEVGQAIEDLASKRGQFVIVDGQAISDINVAKQMYEELGNELEQSGQKLADMDMRSKDLANNIRQVKLDPSTSEEAQNTATALNQAAQRANRLANEAQLTERNIKNALDEKVPNRWDDAVKRGNKTAKNMAASIRKVGKEAKGTLSPLEKMVRTLLRMARFTFFYSVFRAAFRGMREYLVGLLSTQSNFIDSLKAVKVNLMTAFQPIFTAIMPALNALMSGLATATAYMAQFISMLFGQSYEASRAAAQATNQQAEALKNVGKEAKKASKSVQGFDQLNRQQSEDEGGGGGAGAGGTSALFEQIPMPTLDPKWSKLFTDMIDDIKEAAEPTMDALKNLWEVGLEPLMDFTWQGLKDFWTHFLVPIGTWVLGEGLPRFVDAIANQLALVDWEILNGALERMWNALVPFITETIGEGLLWFWENVITPLAGWALNNLIPAAIDLITAAIEFLGNIIDAAMPALQWFWDTFLVPIRDFLWEVVIDFINLFTEAFQKLSDWAKENPEVIETISKIVLAFLAGLWVYNTTKRLVDFLIKLGQQFVTFAGQMGTMVVAALPAAAILALAAAIVVISGMWNKLSPAQRAGVILAGLAAAAIAAAIAIAVFHAAWSVGIAAAVIIGSIAAIGVAFAELKKNTGQSWDVKTPTIDPFGSAGSGDADSFMNTLSSSPPLPALAQGGLIPPRKPRAVIVGDNQYEEEIVSPRSAIREEVKNAIAELGGVNGTDAQVITLLTRILNAILAGHTIEMDSRELGRTIIRTIRSVQNQTGQTQIQTVPGR